MSEMVFVYDHRVMQGSEESDIDPSTAILFFYPSNTSLQDQHELSSQLMGIVKLTPSIIGSPVKLFRLAGGCVACIHPQPHGQLTFAYFINNNAKSGEDNCVVASVSTEDVYRQADNLYRIILFYHGCPRKLFEDNPERPKRMLRLNNAMVRYASHITHCGAILPSLMQPIDQYTVTDSLIYQVVISLLDECTSEWPYVIGGFLAYKGKLVVSQIPLAIAHRLLIIKMRHIQNGSSAPEFLEEVAIQETFIRPGVAILRCMISIEEWRQIWLAKEACAFTGGVVDNHFEILEAQTLPERDCPMPQREDLYCCNLRDHVQVQIYVEAHSDVFLAFVLKETYEWSSKDLDEMHRHCFPVIGELEYKFLHQDLVNKEPSRVSATTHGEDHVETIVFDRLDNTLEGNEAWTQPSITPETGWDTQVKTYISLLHAKLQEDEDVGEIKISLPEGSQFVAKRQQNREVFHVKKRATS